MRDEKIKSKTVVPYHLRDRVNTPEEYDAYRREQGKSFFDSNGNWVEFDAPDNSLDLTASDAAGGVVLIIASILRIGVEVALVVGGIYGFGLFMGWW